MKNMKIILLEKVEKLGDIGDVVGTRPGYARNCLIPGGKAELATPANMEKVERRKAELEQQAQREKAAAQERADKINEREVVLEVAVSEEGNLFGSVGTAEIAEAVAKAGVEIARHEVRLPDGVFRELGDYRVELHFHADVNAVVRLKVVGK